jgi:glycosyltransferase involved in cell wall biosynthesis
VARAVDASVRPTEFTDAHVTIALPTFNGAHFLERAIDSVLRQTYRSWELIISDNASTDGTRAVCERAAASDERITYVRQSVNLGMTGNFAFLAEVSSGPYFMYLGDDDWLAETFVEKCVKILEERPDVVSASGCTRVYEGEHLVAEVPPIQVSGESGVHRVLAYTWARGNVGSTYYGLRRRSAQARIGSVPSYLGMDKSELAALAYIGKLVAIPDTYYAKLRPAGDSAVHMAERMGVSTFQGRHPTLTRAYFGFADIGWRLRAYEPLSRPARLGLGLAATALSLSKRAIERTLKRRGLRLVRQLGRHARRTARRIRRRPRRVARRIRRRVLRQSRRIVRSSLSALSVVRRVVVRSVRSARSQRAPASSGFPEPRDRRARSNRSSSARRCETGAVPRPLEHGEQVVEVDGPKRPVRRNGAKSDELDSVRAAREA